MIFFDASWRYLSAWGGAFTRPGRRLAPLSPRRVLVLALLPLGFLLLLAQGLCLGLDRLLFPGYRRVRLERPVFVVGVPRSGTTYLHRRLAEDTAFTTPATWELLLAPSLCQRWLVRQLGRLDRSLGAPLHRLLIRLTGSASADVSAVHEIGLEAAEEDYLALLAAAGCFFAVLALPQSRALRDLGDLDRMPAARRERLLDHYHGLLQRHVYAHGQRQLLSKNAAFASWLPYLAARYPDALFVVCIRKPETALSSQLSSLTGARTAFASFPEDGALTELFSAYYERWFDVLEAWLSDSRSAAVVVEQEVMRRHGDAVRDQIYARLERKAPATAHEPASEPAAVHVHAPADWPLPPASLARMHAVHARIAARATTAPAPVKPAYAL